MLETNLSIETPVDEAACDGMNSLFPRPLTRQETWGQPPASCYYLVVEGDILTGQLIVPQPAYVSQVSSLQIRHSQALQQALEIQQEEGDPILNLTNLLDSIPGAQEDWEALIDEPY